MSKSGLEPERVVKIDDALELEWYENDTLVAYVLSKMSPEVLQNWSGVALDVLKNWPADQPYLALYDLSHSGIIISYLNLVRKKMLNLGIIQAGEKQALEIVAQRKSYSARVALYASLRYSGHMGRLFAKLDSQKMRFDRMVQYDVFYEREAALNWLKKARTQTP